MATEEPETTVPEEKEAEPSKKKKSKRLPRGVGRVPEWWMEITPHDVLYIEEEEEQRQKELEEAVKFAQLAAEQDLLQKYGGEGFPNWNPATDGPRTAEEEKEWTSKGYKRTEKGEWVDEEGNPLEGRLFQGQPPPGYLPGQYFNPPAGAGGVGGGLSSNKYQRDDNKTWSQPSWTKMKLRSTDSGTAIRKGNYVASPKKETRAAAVPAETPEIPALEEEAPAPEEPVTEEVVVEEPEKTEPEGLGTLVKHVTREVPESEEAALEESFVEEEIIEEEEIFEEIVYEDEEGNEVYE